MTTQLQTHLIQRGLLVKHLAEATGLSRSYCSEISTGSKRPPLWVACLIAEWTRGEVPASSFLDPEDHARLVAGLSLLATREADVKDRDNVKKKPAPAPQEGARAA